MLGYLGNICLHPSNAIYQSRRADRPCEAFGASRKSVATSPRTPLARDACELGYLDSKLW